MQEDTLILGRATTSLRKCFTYVNEGYLNPHFNSPLINSFYLEFLFFFNATVSMVNFETMNM